MDPADNGNRMHPPTPIISRVVQAPQLDQRRLDLDPLLRSSRLGTVRNKLNIPHGWPWLLGAPWHLV